MASRTVTVDIKGFLFTVQLALVGGLFAAAWFAWVPLSQVLFADEKESVATAHALAAIDSSPAAEETAPPENNTPNKKDTPQVGPGGVFAGESIARVHYSVPRSGSFVAVDLVVDTVTLYLDGRRIDTLSIVNAPLRDTPNALREGGYSVSELTDMEVSILTMTRFPHYVRFGDGYAFHGQPSDERGLPLEAGYGGGSVELATEDAEKLAQFVRKGTPLYVRVYAGTPVHSTDTALKVVGTSVPATSATSFVVADMARGQVLLDKDAGKTRSIASITKLVTAAVASELIEHGTEVKAPNGEQYMLGDLFYPLLLRSDNVVAAGIASHFDKKLFISGMNEYVQTLGMPVTSFRDASGLSAKNSASAFDLVTLARHLYLHKRYLLDISREETMTITSATGVDWSMNNQNKLAGDPHYVGGKLGYTDEAGQTALSLFNVPIDGEVRVIAVTVLGSKDWKQDTRTLLRWLLENVEVNTL